MKILEEIIRHKFFPGECFEKEQKTSIVIPKDEFDEVYIVRMEDKYLPELNKNGLLIRRISALKEGVLEFEIVNTVSKYLNLDKEKLSIFFGEKENEERSEWMRKVEDYFDSLFTYSPPPFGPHSKMKHDIEDFDGRRWYEVFSLKITTSGPLSDEMRDFIGRKFERIIGREGVQCKETNENVNSYSYTWALRLLTEAF